MKPDDRSATRNAVNLALMAQDIAYIKNEVSEIKLKLEADYLTREEFKSFKEGRFSFVEKGFWGVISLFAVSVGYAILGLIGLKK